MTVQEWDRVAARIAAWWPATAFTPEIAAVWFEDLADIDTKRVVGAIETLKRQGGRFAPSLGEVLAECDERDEDPAPSFGEALRLFARSVSAARGDGEQAALGWLAANAPAVVAEWVVDQGYDRLRLEPVNDPDHGGATRHRLERAWTEFLARRRDGHRRGVAALAAERRVAALQAGGQERAGLRQVDPAGLLGLGGTR